MNSTITTTIRWDPEELNDIKKAAKRIGLPVALYVKSLVLAKTRHVQDFYDIALQSEILLAKKEAKEGHVDTFNSKEDLLDDLKSNM